MTAYSFIIVYSITVFVYSTFTKKFELEQHFGYHVSHGTFFPAKGILFPVGHMH